jgi:taurine dioxygenase
MLSSLDQRGRRVLVWNAAARRSARHDAAGRAATALVAMLAEQVRFEMAFGELAVHAALNAFPDAPEVVVFDTEAQAITAEWSHADVTAAPAPPLGSILQVVIAPPKGGATHWANIGRAYDALDNGLQARLEGLHALHRSCWEPVEESVHPLVRTHPQSRRKVLFLNRIFTKRIVELDEGESKELFAHLCDHAIRDEFTVRHDWKSGDTG